MSKKPLIAGILIILSGIYGGIGQLIGSFGKGLTDIEFFFMLVYFGGILAGYNSIKRREWNMSIAIVILFIIGFTPSTIKSLSVGQPGAILYLILSLIALIMLIISKNEFD
jgi:hypothetical protein